MANQIEFDLSALPPQERFEFWHDSGSRIYRPCQLKDYWQDDLRVCSRLVQLGPVVMGRMESSIQQYERTDHMVKRDQIDYFHLIFLEKGEIFWNSSQQAFSISSGDFLLLDAAQPIYSNWSEHRIAFVNFPRDILAPLSGGAYLPMGGILKAGSPSAKVLAQHLKSLWNCQASAGDESLAGLGAGLSALVRAYFQDCLVPPLLDVAVDERPLLLSSMQDWIRGQLDHADLDAQEIGRFFHCSRSTVYALFKPYGGVRAYVQSLRLERARELLCSPGVGKISIGRLAMHLGFSGVAVFSRAFRERWGMSPKEMRAQFMDVQGSNSFLANNSARADSAQSSREQLKHACEN